MKIATDTKKLIEQMLIYDKKIGKYIHFILWPIQEKFLEILHLAKRIIVLKKRQTGMSQLTGADSLAQCMILKNFTVLILSKSGDDAREYLNRVRDMYNSLPDEIKAACPLSKNTQEEISFITGSRIISLPSNRGAGMTADRVIIDEAAFITKSESKIDLETVLKRVEPTLDKAEGQLVLISTANGMNLFRKYFMNAINKFTSFVSFFISCWDDPTYTKSKRDQQIQDHGEDHVNQEYPRTWQEAFLSSGRPRFDTKIVSYYEELAKQYHVIAKGNIINDREGRQTVELNDNGFISFYKKREPRGQYLISADISEGLEHGDYTHAKVFELPSMEQVATWHGHIEPAEFGAHYARMGRHWNNATLCPERNNHGHTVLATTRREEKYPDALIHISRPKHREHHQDHMTRPQAKFGFETTGTMKPIIVDYYAQSLMTKDVPWMPEEDVNEHYTYVKDSQGRTNAESGCFDDRIMAACIGWYIAPQYIKAPPPDWQNCGNCMNFDNTKTKEGWCKRSMRWTTVDSYCRLWRELVMFSAKDKRMMISGRTGK